MSSELHKVLADPVASLYAVSAAWLVVKLVRFSVMNCTALVALAICLLIEQGLLVFYVIYLRTVSATFLNPEDGFGAKRDAKSKSPSKSPRPGSSDRLRNLLERANNAHRNAMENIFVFFTIGFLYALTGPSVIVARWLYGVYVASRTIYPILYIKGIQPFRSFAFTIPFAIQLYMAYVVIHHVYSHV